MNLDGILKEGSLTDLTWYQDGMKNPGEITFNPEGSKNPNNTKPEAQDQWGYGDISPIFDEDIAGVVDRHIPLEDLGDVAPVVIFARDLMNKGADAKTVDREIKANFTKEEMRQGIKGLKELIAMDGIIGRIAIDARGYKNCEQAKRATENSPYKRYLKFVIGCTCGDPHMIPVADEKMEIVASTGNVADDFFAMSDAPHQVKTIPHCQSIRMPLYAAIDDLDPEWTNDLLTVVENISGVPAGELEKIKMLDAQPVKKAQTLFRVIDKIATDKEVQKYASQVDASEFMIEAGENEIELFAEAMPEMDIDGSAGDFMGQEVPSILAEIEDIDMAMDTQGTIFEDSDVIELDDEIEVQPDLDIDINDSEMSW
jgi:hypothetical protein